MNKHSQFKHTKRKHHTPAEKADVVRRHVFKKVAISDLADEMDVQPSVIYGWIKLAEENLAAAFDYRKGHAIKDMVSKY